MNKKSVFTTIAAMALTATLAVGGTLAYMSSVTETRQNTFSSDSNIKTTLKEEHYDPEEAKDYTPGKVVYKDPTITNDATSTESVWIAVSLEYTNGAENITKTAFEKYAAIQGFDNVNWVKIATGENGEELYMYDTKVDAGASTKPIFQSVMVNAGIEMVKKSGISGDIVYTYDGEGNLIDVKDNTENIDEIKFYDANGDELNITKDDLEATLPTFEIKVTGYAVQTSDIEKEPAKTELINLANGKLDAKFVAD